MTRPSWDRYYMGFARVAATRATCPRRHVGAILVCGSFTATGYNGAPSGEPHCDDVGCLMVDGHCKRSTHAEVNALDHAAFQVDHGTLYTTASPCVDCASALISHRIARVVYRDEYPAPEALALLRRWGVVVERIGR